MPDKQYKQHIFQTKVLDEKNRIIEMIGSTEDYDRVNDKMLMSGCQLQNYLKNAVILANHNYGDTEKPSVIGKALEVKIEGTKLIFKIQFAETDNGKEWFYLYSNGYMNASSIGFIPIEYKPNDKGGYDFNKWELLELSLVTVPCNPNAVQRAYDDKKISKALFDLINKNDEREVEDMKTEEIQALVDKIVDEKVTSLKEKHVDEISTKVKEIDKLNEKIKGLEVQVQEKTGATLSKASADKLTSICEGLKSNADILEKFIQGCAKDDEPDGDEGKEYSEEDIRKMVQENVEKLIKEGK